MLYQLVNQNHPQAMRLQNIGVVLGTPASEIKTGSVLMWNFGHKSKVEAIKSETEKTIVIEVDCNGKLYTQRLSKSRLVCILQ